MADRCAAEQMPVQEEIVRRWLPEREPDKLYLFVIDDQPDPAALPEEADPKLKFWQTRFRQLRAEQAESLVALAEKAVDAERLSLAMMLLTEAVRENPDHERARAALGYQRYRDRWLTPFEREMAEQGNLWHDRFGWIDADQVDRYQAGLRPFGRRWIDAEEDARLRRHITRGWQLRTEHYLLTTNHSLEAGARLARQLECFYQIWRQVFAGYYLEPGELERALARRAPRYADSRPHRVIYFRSREEYNQQLRRDQPNIEITLGIYFDTQKRAYFFAGEDQHAGTLYHEAAHQLFQETSRSSRQVGRQDNFWIIEGIAAYLESLTEHEGYYTLGGAEAGRLPAARQRCLEDDFYVPLAQLVALGMSDVQRHPDIAKLYSQAAGQATFLMHAESGRYREAVVRYLVSVYQGRDTTGSLEELTGARYAQLDEQYRAWLASLAGS